MTLARLTVPTPIGDLVVEGHDAAVTAIRFGGPAGNDHAEAVDACAQQLTEFFAGERQAFDLPLEPERGGAFDRLVWAELARIPYGETRSYGEVAAAIGKPTSVRAVGAANGRNPIPVVVPCHRVIGANGSLTGFAGGLATKRHLLDLEHHRCLQTALL